MALQTKAFEWPRVTPIPAEPALRLRPYASALVPAVDVLALTAGIRFVAGASPPACLYLLAALAVLAFSGCYRARIAPRVAGELPHLCTRLALPLLPIGALWRHSPQLPSVLAAAPVAVALLLVGRSISYAAIRGARARGELVERTLIIGSGNLGVEVARTLQDHSEYGLVPVGFLDGFEPGNDLPLPLLGDVHHLDGVLQEFDIRRVIVAWGAHREADMVRVLRACDHANVELHALPRFFELGVSSGSETDDIWGIPLVRIRRAALRTAAWRLKRVFDLTFASLALVLASPLLLACALAVRLSTPGPIFFRQKRVGQQGHIVEIFKFRSMRLNDGSDTIWNGVDGDERCTAIGRLMRRTSLDELPQLFNVLRGDMSLVGPRPERPFFVDRFNTSIDRYDDRHRVPVGMTGWAQVHGLRGDTSITERARFDNHYIEQWSLWEDVVILVRTATAVLRQVIAR
jgi:exopolysaccharide biosynthesis polyprenyl glycosylphosphotransferase